MVIKGGFLRIKKVKSEVAIVSPTRRRGANAGLRVSIGAFV